ncbi:MULTISPECIES: response regulator transcription factor [Planktothrix]|jgi:DNA-binding response OmpR family regulator|nr:MULTISPECIES: response regulator transcription factor [Planktothrix]MCF3608458.1 response regulator transcription factor [Planktothrix agardhii 1033]BBD54499.1 two-component response regulator [Planktothrix agardhii NIES-204]MBG0745766.1 response regulator transcription factor [Planktothrix agardhii KL2]MCB8752583.1 response regulator transcription factor [Planktothrix agardhii 1810]MCB8761613.1 response regulator transcription factor [Planktothrix agardhii 1813]
MASVKILVVDDDPAIRNLISRYLSQQDYQVEIASDGHSALERFEQFNPDLVVLDLNLPDTTGLALCREMQSRTSVFILMLTSEKDPKLGLKEGADDFVTKPFDLEELNLRIKAILKRQRNQVDTQPKNLIYGDLIIDPNRREVYISGELIALSALEFDLLYCLARKPGRAWRRPELLQEVWGYEYENEQRVVDVHIGQIRKKIELDVEQPSFIKTIRGVGYMFDRRTGER